MKQAEIMIGFETAIEEVDRLTQEAVTLHSGDPARAIERATTAHGLASALGYRLGEARSLRARGMAHGARGQIDEAIDDFQTALEIACSCEEKRIEAQCLQGLSAAYYYRAEYTHALEMLYRSLVLRQEMNDIRGEIHCRCSLGSFHGALGNYPEAALQLTESLRLAEQVSDTFSSLNTYSNLALLKKECGEIDAAESYFRLAVGLSESEGDRSFLSNTLSNLADLLNGLRRREEAAEAAERALALARELENPHREITALLALSSVRIAQGRYDDATSSLQAAVTSAEKIDIGRQRVALLHALGNCCRHQRQFADARRHLEQALELATAGNEKQAICDIRYSLMELCEAEGGYQAALGHFRAYHDITQALEKQAMQNLLTAQMAKITLERAEQEASNYQRQSAAMEKANAENVALLAELQTKAHLLARQTMEDPLTGLYNRRYLHAYLEQELHRLHRNGLPLTVAIADLDTFKGINERFSYRIGDSVLKTAANLLQQHCRRSDVVVRYGGEEFLILFTETSVAAARQVCERIRTTIADFPWSNVAPGLRVTISIGLAAYNYLPVQANTAQEEEALLGAADHCLKEAKQQGKDRVVG